MQSRSFSKRPAFPFHNCRIKAGTIRSRGVANVFKFWLLGILLMVMVAGLSVSHAGIGMAEPVDPVPNESCSQKVATSTATFSLPDGYQIVLADFADGSIETGSGPEDDGRVRPTLRAQAQLQDARLMLVNAVLAQLGKLPSYTIRINGTDPKHNVPGSKTIDSIHYAMQIAQLAVTGRKAFESFVSWHAADNPPPAPRMAGPQIDDLVNLIMARNSFPNLDPTAVRNAARTVLDQAYATLYAVRDNSAAARTNRMALGWVAVSGEDDTPHRPVNVETAPYPQFDIDVTAAGSNGNVTVRTRYMIASKDSFIGPGDPPPGQTVNKSLGTPFGGIHPVGKYLLPVEVQPSIPAGDSVIIYIHGGGSRAEEAVPLANALIAEGAKRGQGLTIISFDLPNSAYGDRLKVPQVTPADYHPSKFHVFTFEQMYVIGFIDALEKQFPGIKGRIAAVMGGSLGGNLSLKLARLSKVDFPYLRNVVAWSVTAMNPTHLGDLGDWITWLGVQGKGDETATTRADFFHNLFYENTSSALGLPPQPQMWWRSSWKDDSGTVDCKAVHTAESRFARYEIYSPEMRKWSADLNAEQAMYSFHDKDDGASQTRFQTVDSRVLLASGEKDRYGTYNDIYAYTHDVGQRMPAASGRMLLIHNTGHSIHDERPVFFAQEIVDFLKTTDVQLQLKLTTGSDDLGPNSQAWAVMRAGTNSNIVPLTGIIETLNMPSHSTLNYTFDLSRLQFRSSDITLLGVQFISGKRGFITDTQDNWDVDVVEYTGLPDPNTSFTMLRRGGTPFWHATAPQAFWSEKPDHVAPEPAVCAGLKAQATSDRNQIAADQAQLQADGQEQSDCEAGQGEVRDGSRNKPSDCDATAHQTLRTTITNNLNKLNADLTTILNQESAKGCFE